EHTCYTLLQNSEGLFPCHHHLANPLIERLTLLQNTCRALSSESPTTPRIPGTPSPGLKHLANVTCSPSWVAFQTFTPARRCASPGTGASILHMDGSFRSCMPRRQSLPHSPDWRNTWVAASSRASAR